MNNNSACACVDTYRCLQCRNSVKDAEAYATFLRNIATQLEKWALESRKGGWSTHQEKPMKDLATEIWAELGRRSIR